MQLSYVENDKYFLSMDSSIDGNMYMILRKKINPDYGERILEVKITERCYKRGSMMYHDLEDRIKKNKLIDEYVKQMKKQIAGLIL